MIVSSRAPVRVDFGGGWTDVDIFARGAGGVVLNATINKYVTGRLVKQEHGDGAASREGLDVSYGFDLPSGSGLGTSSALNVVWLSLIKSQIVTGEDRRQIAELAYRLETILGILGGKQDQYAAAVGGFNLMTFTEAGVGVETLAVAPDTVRELEARSVLCYTGKPRLSGSIHENVWGAFRAGNPATVSALYALRDAAERMKPALLGGDLDAFADLIGENWQHQKALDPSVTNPQIDALFAAAQAAGARGGKACGAGGGGCLLFITEPGRQENVAGALAARGAQIIPFAFEFDGLTVSVER
jgi:D-glycero-alpha-D-manno-heptose-7-phosphate kinase